MSAVSKELIYEMLKQVELTLDRIERKVDEVRSEVIALRKHQISMTQDFQNFRLTWAQRIP